MLHRVLSLYFVNKHPLATVIAINGHISDLQKYVQYTFEGPNVPTHLFALRPPCCLHAVAELQLAEGEGGRGGGTISLKNVVIKIHCNKIWIKKRMKYCRIIVSNDRDRNEVLLRNSISLF